MARPYSLDMTQVIHNVQLLTVFTELSSQLQVLAVSRALPQDQFILSL